MVENASEAEQGWPKYVAAFHAERAGITEDVLEQALDEAGRTPYSWAADALQQALPAPTSSAPPLRVLDLACGSAPMASRLTGTAYVGIDLSEAELARARGRGLAVAQADAGRLPLADASVDAVVMSMSLMLVPLHQTLSEIRRVLRPGGPLVATVPHNRPMPARDWLRYGCLCVALRHPGLSYPNDALLQEPAHAFAAAALTLTTDTERSFACDLATTEIADQLLASLYLPDVDPSRLDAGRRVVRRWVGTTITTPIRLLAATATTPALP